MLKSLFAKFLAVKNPVVIGTTNVAAVEVVEQIPVDANGVKLLLQAFIAIATLVKYIRDARDARKQKNGSNNG